MSLATYFEAFYAEEELTDKLATMRKFPANSCLNQLRDDDDWGVEPYRISDEEIAALIAEEKAREEDATAEALEHQHMEVSCWKKEAAAKKRKRRQYRHM